MRQVLDVISHVVILNLRVLGWRPVERRFDREQRRDRLAGVQRACAFLRFLYFRGEGALQNLQSGRSKDLEQSMLALRNATRPVERDTRTCIWGTSTGITMSLHSPNAVGDRFWFSFCVARQMIFHAPSAATNARTSMT